MAPLPPALPSATTAPLAPRRELTPADIRTPGFVSTPKVAAYLRKLGDAAEAHDATEGR